MSSWWEPHYRFTLNPSLHCLRVVGVLHVADPSASSRELPWFPPVPSMATLSGSQFNVDLFSCLQYWPWVFGGCPYSLLTGGDFSFVLSKSHWCWGRLLSGTFTNSFNEHLCSLSSGWKFKGDVDHVLLYQTDRCFPLGPPLFAHLHISYLLYISIFRASSSCVFCSLKDHTAAAALFPVWLLTTNAAPRDP